MKTIIRIILGCALAGTLLLTGCQPSSATKQESKRPNIIYIMSDDHAAQAISAYGGIYDSIAPTPNIDRLANEGILFNNVFCTNAICGPSRAAILTGKYSHINGYYKNESGGQINSDQWTFPEELQRNGYRTALIGKWHLGSEPKGFDHFKFHSNAGQQGSYWDPEYNENGKIVSEKGYATNLTTDFALDWLRANEKENDPFCMLLQYKAPHRPWSPDKKYEDLWEDIDMPYPETFNDDYKGREKTAGDTDMTMNSFNRRDMKLNPPENLSAKERREWMTYGNDREEYWKPDENMTDQEAREWKYQTYIKDYLACIRSVDDNIGRVLEYLKETGQLENTVIIYTADQGFYLGEHGWFDKRFIYEESLRMPFIMRFPKQFQANTTNDDIITNIDFAPTILEIAGVQAPEDVQGRSFLANLKGNKPADWPESMYYHYYEFPFWHHVQPHYGIRNSRYKLIHFYYSVNVWELYDLKTDPKELNNLIDDPAYSSLISDMKSELQEKMKYYKNDKSLDKFREITDKDFGNIMHE
jgi:arylsulfatase A-like enzyme